MREGPVDLKSWTAVNYSYPLNKQSYAKWEVSADGQSVTQTVNADPSVFVSDHDLGRATLSGTWLVQTRDDDDFIGFVFGYQDPGRFYLFDWKRNSQQDSGVGTATRGMCVKVVAVAYQGRPSGRLEPSKPFDGLDLWHTDGVQGRVRLLHHEPTEGWKAHHPYRFRLDFIPGRFRILVTDSERVLLDKTFEDDTYRTGRFGFYNFSQGRVTYRGFETVAIPVESDHTWLVILVIVVVLVVVAIVIVVFVLVAVRRSRGRSASP